MTDLDEWLDKVSAMVKNDEWEPAQETAWWWAAEVPREDQRTPHRIPGQIAFKGMR